MAKSYGYYILLFFLSSGLLYADSVWLMNDAPYTLVAKVKSAEGREIGQVTIKAGQQNHWVTSLNPKDLKTQYDAIVSSTPYTVTWYCPHGGFYSFCTGVSPGGLITANQCDGAHYCQPPPKKEKKKDCCCDCCNQKK